MSGRYTVTLKNRVLDDIIKSEPCGTCGGVKTFVFSDVNYASEVKLCCRQCGKSMTIEKDVKNFHAMVAAWWCVQLNELTINRIQA